MKIHLLFFSLLSTISLLGQNLEQVVERDRTNAIARLVFYNVENLFDTLADANVADEEFLPNAEKGWDTRKYRIKIANTAKTIRAVGGWQAPEIVGLAEIENRSVLLSLAEHESLRNANYDIVHFDSPDPRGIDVGVLFNSTLFSVLHTEPIRVRMEPQSRTRDILYVKFLAFESDTLHVFVNHWSSRRGGKDASSYKRVAAAQTLKVYTDSILKITHSAQIVVMGDFNDSPSDESLAILTHNEDDKNLVNLMGTLPATEGSHKYKGVWDYLDQILVSRSLLDSDVSKGLVGEKAVVFNAPFLLEEDDRYGDSYPLRTWKGSFFTAGFSDHLPVFCDISFKK